MMHGPINVKSPNNTSKWQMGINSAFKGLMCSPLLDIFLFFDVPGKKILVHKLRLKLSRAAPHKVRWQFFTVEPRDQEQGISCGIYGFLPRTTVFPSKLFAHICHQKLI
jgi:hypothetical protein